MKLEVSLSQVLVLAQVLDLVLVLVQVQVLVQLSLLAECSPRWTSAAIAAHLKQPVWDENLPEQLNLFICFLFFFFKHHLIFQECSKRANYGKFTLRDLLVVPMQRVLKYHLLLQVNVCFSHRSVNVLTFYSRNKQMKPTQMKHLLGSCLFSLPAKLIQSLLSSCPKLLIRQNRR